MSKGEEFVKKLDAYLRGSNYVRDHKMSVKELIDRHAKAKKELEECITEIWDKADGDDGRYGAECE